MRAYLINGILHMFRVQARDRTDANPMFAWYRDLTCHLLIVIGLLLAFLCLVLFVIHISESVFIGAKRPRARESERRGFEVVMLDEQRQSIRD
jgi:hypothetical protein